MSVVAPAPYLTPKLMTFTLGRLPDEEAAMEVVDVKTKAKVILKEIMEQSPDDHDLTAIWDVWFERMADGVHLVYLNPTQLAELKQSFDDAYAELIAPSGPSGPLAG
jgi:hypothetical protein